MNKFILFLLITTVTTPSIFGIPVATRRKLCEECEKEKLLAQQQHQGIVDAEQGSVFKKP